MSTAFVTNSWSVPSPVQRGGGWRFGVTVELARGGVVTQAMQWALGRNWPLKPRRALAVYAALCALSFGVGSVFWWNGASGVLPFAGLEAALLGLLLLWYARHAADHETITLTAREFEVEHQFGRRVKRVSFRAEWVSIEPVHGDASLVELSGEGRRVRVGRYLKPELRPVLARELRTALKRVRDRSLLTSDGSPLGAP